MTISKIIALVLCGSFYIAYIAKMLMLKKRSIKGDILGKGSKPKVKAVFEAAMKAILYLGAAIQFFSIIFDGFVWSPPAYPTMTENGLILMLMGLSAFLAAVVTMKNNWRAGYNDEQNTQLVTNGIYKYSRNPAFLGFDFLYLGCALVFPSLLNIGFSVVIIILFHIQILGEEAFLAKTFGVDYASYKVHTFRYLGRRKNNQSKKQMTDIKSKKQGIFTFVLSGIYLLILSWLILFKLQFYVPIMESGRVINLIPLFGSFNSDGRILVYELRLNILAFIPFGVYICMLKSKWFFVKKVLAAGTLALTFEVIQFIFAMGRADITDVLSNTLGGVIGMGIYALAYTLLKDRTNKVISIFAAILTVSVLSFVAVLLLNGRWVIIK